MAPIKKMAIGDVTPADAALLREIAKYHTPALMRPMVNGEHPDVTAARLEALADILENAPPT
jgi:hypothetical protein